MDNKIIITGVRSHYFTSTYKGDFPPQTKGGAAAAHPWFAELVYRYEGVQFAKVGKAKENS